MDNLVPNQRLGSSYPAHFCSIPLPSRDVQLVHLKYILHRGVLIHDYSEFLLHAVEFQTAIRTEQPLVICAISRYCIILYKIYITN